MVCVCVCPMSPHLPFPSAPAHPASSVCWLIVQPSADHVEGCHSCHHGYTAYHASSQGHQPAVLQKPLQGMAQAVDPTHCLYSPVLCSPTPAPSPGGLEGLEWASNSDLSSHFQLLMPTLHPSMILGFTDDPPKLLLDTKARAQLQWQSQQLYFLPPSIPSFLKHTYSLLVERGLATQQGVLQLAILLPPPSKF